jgi:hypothetical protein
LDGSGSSLWIISYECFVFCTLFDREVIDTAGATAGNFLKNHAALLYIKAERSALNQRPRRLEFFRPFDLSSRGHAIHFPLPLDVPSTVQIGVFLNSLWLIPHPCLWRLRMWNPLPPSLSPMHLSRSLLPHPLNAWPPHTSAASCSSPFLAPTDVMTA